MTLKGILKSEIPLYYSITFYHPSYVWVRLLLPAIQLELLLCPRFSLLYPIVYYYISPFSSAFLLLSHLSQELFAFWCLDRNLYFYFVWWFHSRLNTTVNFIVWACHTPRSSTFSNSKIIPTIFLDLGGF